MRQTLVIADYDDNFVVSLEDYLFTNYDDEFEIRTLTSKEKLENFFSIDRRVDILLLNPLFQFEGMSQQYIDNIVFISNEENDNSMSYESIYRFGELNYIYNRLRSITCKNKDINDITSSKAIIEKSKVISVYSPIGGVGKSSISMAVAVELSSRGNNVLYLNLENMPTTNAYFNTKTNLNNLSHIIEQIGYGGSNLESYINQSLNKDSESKVFYINPSDNIFALEQLNPDDIRYFIGVVANMSKFNYIVIDTTSTYDTLKKAIIDASDKVIVPIGQDEISKQKLSNLLCYIDEEELYKFVPIINKYREELLNHTKEIGNINDKFQIQGFIEYYEPLEESSSYMKVFVKHNPFMASIKSIMNF